MGLKSIEGYSLDKDYNISFATEVLKMYLISSHPDNLEVDVNYSSFYATFDYDIDVPTIAGNVELLQGVDVIPSTISIDLSNTKQINIVPDGDLLHNTEYIMRFKIGLTGEGRDLYQEYNVSFTTVPVMKLVSSHPESDEIDVNYSSFYTILDYNVDVSTIADNVELLLIDTPVPSTISIDANPKRINIVPDEDLLHGSVYTIHLKTGLTGEGYLIDQEYNINFTTEIPVMLLLTSSPVVEELDVKYRNFYATFDYNIDVLTIADNVELLLVDTPVLATISIDVNPKRINIIPTESLPALTVYTLHFKTGLTGEGRNLNQEHSISFTTGEVYQLHMTASHPINGEIDVGYRVFYADFDFNIDSGTVADNVELLLDSIPVPCDISSDLARITITPTGELMEGEEYVLHFKTGLTGEGYSIDQEYSISFTTGVMAVMTLVWADSFPDAYDITDVALTDTFWLVFDYDIDAGTVAANVELLLGGEVVPANIYVYGEDYPKEIDIEPDSPLLLDSEYTIRLKTGLTGEGYSLDQEYNINFMTISSSKLLGTDPADLEENVPVDDPIAITFNMPMSIDNLDEYGSSIELRKVGGELLIGGYTLSEGDPSTIIMSHGAMEGGVEYTVTVYPWTDLNHKGVISAAGNPLDKEYTFSFTTNVVMSAISYDPVEDNYEQIIPVDKVLTVTYSKNIDPLSVILPPTEGYNVFMTDNGFDPMGYEGDVSFTTDVTGKILSIIPDSNLIPGHFYTYGTGPGIKSTDVQESDNTVLVMFRVPSIAFTVMSGTVPESGTVDDFSIIGEDSIVATFDKDIFSSSLNEGGCVLSSAGVPSLYCSFSVDGDEVTVTPSVILTGDTEYTLTFYPPHDDVYGVYSTAGESLDQEYSMTFITEPNSNYMWNTGVNPVYGQTGVARSINPTITFDMNVDPTTVTYGPGSTVNLKRGSTNIAGSVSVVDNVITIIPSAPLNANTLHNFTVTVDVYSLTGKRLVQQVYISFRTGASL